MDTLRDQFRARMPEVITDLRARTAEVEAPAREAGYSITNQVDGEAVVRIYDEIWFLGVNAQDLAADLDAITAPKIRVEINSPGGDVWDGIAIYNALRAHPAEVTTRVDGMAASIASVIAQAGDNRTMLGGSQMMIHNASGLTIGDANTHAEMVEILRQQDRVIAGIYAERSGSPVEGFAAMMDAETWMTATEAVEAGLADEVVQPDRPNSPQDRTPTLNDKIASAVTAVEEAVSSSEQVSAVRAEAGKSLSNVNREGLSGLRDALDRLDGLLTEPVHSDDDGLAEFVHYVALTQGVTTT